MDLVKSYEDGLKTNGYWMNVIQTWDEEGVDINTDYEKLVNALTPVVPNPQPEPEPELQPKPTPNSDPEQPNFFPPALKIQTSRKHLNLVNPKSKLIYLMQVQLAKLQRPTIMRKYSFNLKQNAILAKQY